MKTRCFYLYGCNDEEVYNKKVEIIKNYVAPFGVIRINDYINNPGYLPEVKIRCNKKTWKKLKRELDLCKIIC